ncbi:hypothetical protein Taro_037358 [Colocasia esculenta]|uniref:Uncharacterized protein n=1 Tax=Colocasia esculenta TaxID=4460 RepID=A0A843W0B0_COLES|nr:hypothetical protein [Colocasia esculenta]
MEKAKDSVLSVVLFLEIGIFTIQQHGLLKETGLGFSKAWKGPWKQRISESTHTPPRGLPCVAAKVGDGKRREPSTSSLATVDSFPGHWKHPQRGEEEVATAAMVRRRGHGDDGGGLPTARPRRRGPPQATPNDGSGHRALLNLLLQHHGLHPHRRLRGDHPRSAAETLQPCGREKGDGEGEEAGKGRRGNAGRRRDREGGAGGFRKPYL